LFVLFYILKELYMKKEKPTYRQIKNVKLMGNRVLSFMPIQTAGLTCTNNKDLEMYRILGPCCLKPALSLRSPVV
jgi:hypothetical protein